MAEAIKDPELENLRNIARSLGIKPHPRAKAETLRMQINQQPQANKSAVMTHAAEAEVAPSIQNSEEDVRGALSHLIAKEGFEIKFPGDNTVIMRCRGAEESFNLSIPLRVIKMKAETVAQGRKALRSLGKDGTYGQSYTDNILA